MSCLLQFLFYVRPGTRFRTALDLKESRPWDELADRLSLDVLGLLQVGCVGQLGQLGGQLRVLQRLDDGRELLLGLLDFGPRPGQVVVAKPLAAAEAPIRNLSGSVLFPVGDLPEGEYEIAIRLRDAGGKTVSQKTKRPESGFHLRPL